MTRFNDYMLWILYINCMGRTRKDDKKVRVTIRAYESTIKKIKEKGSSLQKEWDTHIESIYDKNEENGKKIEKES